jgi:hypothetical protein
MASNPNSRNYSPDSVIAANRRRPSVMELGTSANFATIITFVEYGYNPSASVVQQDTRASVSTGPSSSIILPLPKQLVENNNITVDGKDLGILGSLTADIASRGGDAIGSLMETLRDTGASAYEQIQNGAFGDVAKSALSSTNFLIRAGIGSLSPQIQDGISAATGDAVNPHQTLTFDGVALKDHTFTFEFAPESTAQSEKIRDAIKILKRAALPEYQSVGGGNGAGGSNTLSRGLLKYPNLIEVSFVGLDQEFFYRFKPAMIRDISVDYSPQGNALLNGGGGGARPAFITLTISFKEQAIWTKEDYN